MRITIGQHSYSFSADVLADPETRASYFHLAKNVFGLSFDAWHRSGFWDDGFIPYVLYDRGSAVSSVGVCVNEVIWKNTRKRYAQISTVMTLPEYRKKGLNRWLMEYVLKEWDNRCDAVYLLGNDSVVDFYPKFGFEEFTEYDFTIPVHKRKEEIRKINIANQEDWALVLKKYKSGNPFAGLQVNNLNQFVFHCLCFLSEDIYYLEAYDAIAIVDYEGNKMTCYELLTDFEGSLDEITGVLARDNTEYARLGFTPKALENCVVEKSREEDNHLFVLSGKENMFKDNRVMFPLLSRA